MSYTPINWQTGDTITAEKMNKMDNGWSVGSSQLFSETVTTVNDGEFNVGALTFVATATPPEVLTVTFDGNSYNCTRQGTGNYTYGADFGDFSEYPFLLTFPPVGAPDPAMIFTETAGTHTISATGTIIEVSSNFNGAVNKCVDMASVPMACVDGTTTMSEMTSAQSDGRFMYFYADGSAYFVSAVNAEVAQDAIVYYPASEDFTAGFDEDEIFTLYWQWD